MTVMYLTLPSCTKTVILGNEQGVINLSKFNLMLYHDALLAICTFSYSSDALRTFF